MNVIEFTALIFGGAVAAGFLGALTGLGGGVVIVPLLTIVFGVDIRYAIGAALVSVIATSSGAAAAYVREGYSNVRVGMFLEIATTLGALAGTVVAVYLHASAIAIVFGVVLIYSAYASLKHEPHAVAVSTTTAAHIALDPRDRTKTQPPNRNDVIYPRSRRRIAHTMPGSEG